MIGKTIYIVYCNTNTIVLELRFMLTYIIIHLEYRY